MLTLDTSAVVALTARRDTHHARVGEALRSDPGPYIVPAQVLAEIAYMVQLRAGPRALLAFLTDVEGGAYQLDCGEEDIPRIRGLMVRYGDLPLGFADAAVIACGERNGGRVLTLDRRSFDVVAREGNVTLVP